MCRQLASTKCSSASRVSQLGLAGKVIDSSRENGLEEPAILPELVNGYDIRS